MQKRQPNMALTASTDYQDMNESEWTAAYEAKYQMAFSSAYSEAQSQIQRESVSNVDVAGIGVIADVNAAASSNFTATSQLIEGAARDGNGNGNASAGANLATSSYANQSNSTTANAFMQAFSGGLPEPEGELVITGISGTANGSTVEGPGQHHQPSSFTPWRMGRNQRGRTMTQSESPTAL